MRHLSVISLLRRHELVRQGKTAARGVVVHNNFRCQGGGHFRHPAFSVERLITDETTPCNQNELEISPHLACVVGKPMSGVLPSHVSDHVAGFCLAARISDQTSTALYRIGPFLTKFDLHFDKANSTDLWLSACDKRVTGSYRNMIWPLSQLISTISAEITLHPGDIVFPGTPIHDSLQQDSVSFGVDNVIMNIDKADLLDKYTQKNAHMAMA